MAKIDLNFYKLSLTEFCNKLEYVVSDKTRVVLYLLNKMRASDNTISTTITSVSEALELSYKLVHSTFQILLGEDFMRKSGPGTYIVNPNIIYKGKGHKNNIIQAHYRSLEVENKDYFNKRQAIKSEATKRRKELKEQLKTEKQIKSILKKEFKSLYN